MTNDELKDHPIARAMAQINAAKQWDEVKQAHGNPESSAQLNRIFGFTDLVGQRTAATPATLISDQGLRVLATSLSSVGSELDAFRADGLATHLASAVTTIDQQGLNQLWALPISPTPEGSVELGRLADDFQNRIQGIVSWFENKRGELSSENTRLAEQLAQQASQITQLGDLIAQQKADAQATNAEVKRDYAIAEQELREKFQTTLDAQVSQGTEIVSQQKMTFATALKTIADGTDELVKDLQNKREEAAKIVQIVGNIGVTGNYQKIAEAEGGMANVWRWITLGVFAAAALFGAITIWDITKDKIIWESALIRLAFTFFIVTIALYTARESARHRTTADRSRRTELELASLGPFLANLPQPKQDEIREKLTYLYFGNSVDPHVVESSIKDAVEALGKLADRATEAAKKIPR